MKIKNQKKSKKPLLISLAVVVAVAAGVAVYFLFFFNSDPTASYQPEYPASVTSSTNTVDEETEKTAPSGNENKTSEQVPVDETGSVTITNLNQKDGYVNALAEVANFTISQCVYSFASDGAKPVVREQTGSCSGVSIPQVEFDKTGTYTLTVAVYSNDKKITTSKEINIQ